MSNYAKLKKLDEESLQKIKEGTGPADECLCSLFTPKEKKSFATSVKKALGFSGKRKMEDSWAGRKGIEVPMQFSRGKGSGPSKEVLKRNKSCKKCGCDDQNIVLKHSYANIRITAPDVSSFCPCPTDCLPDKEKIKNNIQVVVERADIQTPISSAGIDNDKERNDTGNSHD